MEWFHDEGRFLAEIQAINQQFPYFSFGDEDDQIIINGTLRSDRNNYYSIKVVYPYDFPSSEPDVYIEGAEINGTYYSKLPWFHRPRVHMYSSTHLCWNDCNRAGTWDPRRSTAAVAIATIAVWLFCYEAYVFDDDPWHASDH
jgi:hypothetical protein